MEKNKETFEYRTKVPIVENVENVDDDKCSATYTETFEYSDDIKITYSMKIY